MADFTKQAQPQSFIAFFIKESHEFSKPWKHGHITTIAQIREKWRMGKKRMVAPEEEDLKMWSHHHNCSNLQNCHFAT